MANTSSRTLRLLSLMQTHRHWTGAALAEHLGVSERTLRRDVDRLRDLGYPVGAQRGVDGGYQLTPGASLPPLVLDDEEAIALAVGLQSAIQSGTVVGIAESSVRAFTKIVQVMPARLRRQVDSLATMTVPATPASSTTSVEPAVLALIAQACRDLELLEFDYRSREGEQSHRRVEPHRLVLYGRRWYLVAWDRTRHDWRTFRIDRIDSPRSAGSHFLLRALPDPDAATFVRNSIENVSALHEIEVLFAAPAGEVRSRVGAWAQIEELDGDRCVMRMTADSLDWSVVAICATSADFEVRSPPELQDRIRTYANRFTRAVASTSRPGSAAVRSE